MRYIKLYESNKLKKYIIDDMSFAGLYLIFNILSQKENLLRVVKLYSYNLTVNALEEVSLLTDRLGNPIEEEYYYLPKSSFNIIYESDDLEDVKNKLLLVIDAKKYNL